MSFESGWVVDSKVVNASFGEHFAIDEGFFELIDWSNGIVDAFDYFSQ